MNVYVTRDSVAAGDDVDAPHGQNFVVDDSVSVLEIIETIIAAGYLPSIFGGAAAWSVASGVPVAVIAQQWSQPKMTSWRPLELHELDCVNDVLRLHFNYHAQIDPDVVLEVLRRLQLRVG